MKTKIAIIILVVACAGLGIALFATKKQAADEHRKDVDAINSYSNQVVEVNEQLKDLSQANLALTNDLAQSRTQSLELSNALAAATATLDDTRTTLAAAQNQITNLNLRLTDLETQNKALDQRAEQLTNTIAQLNTLIESTQAKLAQSEKNSVFLQEALEKQMAQKAQLEHQFNDINEVQAQVKKLKDEIFIARHIQMTKNMPQGIKLEPFFQRHPPEPKTNNVPAKLPPNFDLNVEVGSDGSVKVIPPMGATNAPAK